MEYLQESGASIHRRRRRRRALITLTVVPVLLVGSFLYATAYVQGWVGTSAPKPVTSAACDEATLTRVVTPGTVTVNVYNSTSREGLAASVAKSLRAQGFRVAIVGNDPLGMSIQGVGAVRRGPTGALGATLAATRLAGAKVVPDNRTDATVDIVLGDKFRALSAPPKVKPPTVAEGGRATVAEGVRSRAARSASSNAARPTPSC